LHYSQRFMHCVVFISQTVLFQRVDQIKLLFNQLSTRMDASRRATSALQRIHHLLVLRHRIALSDSRYVRHLQMFSYSQLPAIVPADVLDATRIVVCR